MSTDRTILVTGASGQLGSALLRRLPDAPVITTLARRPMPPSARRALRIDLAAAPGSLVGVDLATIDAVVLLASRITMSTDLLEIGVQLQLELRATLELLARMPALTQIVYASSCTVYGTPDVPQLAETAPLAPSNIYACSKTATEDLLRVAARARGGQLAVLRIAQVYGPGSPENELVARFCRLVASGQAPAVTCGAAARDYVHEDDVAVAITSALDRRADGTFNIGGGVAHSIASLAERACALRDIAPAPVTLAAPTYSMLLDISRAGAELGYAPSRTPDDEMRRRLETS